MKIAKTFLAGITMIFLMPVMADSQDMTGVWVVDYSGKPPFERKLQTVPTVDLARFESQQAVVVNTTDFRGKPPFARNKETVRVVDVARFETTEQKKHVPLPRRMKY